MTRLVSKLLVTTALLSGSARADTLTIGYWDHSLGGGVTTIASSPGTPIQLLGNPMLLGSGFGFDQISTLLIPANMSGLGGTAPTFEFEFNNGFVPPQGGTIRLYSTWQGATTAGGAITLPSILQTFEMPAGGGIDGLFVNEQIFVCPLGGLFCDNFLVGGGTLVGGTTITDQILATFPTFAGTAPGQPFAITEEFTFGQDRGSFPNAPVGDVGAAILTTPIGQPVAMPGPIAGAGLPGAMLGLTALWGWWRRRNIRRQAAAERVPGCIS
jgi:hypothetical protein